MRDVGAGDRDRDGGRDRDRIRLDAIKQPAPGLRTPDSGPGCRRPFFGGYGLLVIPGGL